MHELSIAMGILEIVRTTCVDQGLGRVQAVRVRIGRATGVDPDAVLFAFDVAKAGTPAADSALEIEAVPMGGHCNGCGADFAVEERYVLACPLCAGEDFRITGGDELQVVDLEVAE